MCQGAGAQDPGYSGTKFSAFYDLHDGGVLKYYDAQNRNSTIWNQIVATNGMAVLDLTAWPSSTAPIFCGGIWTDGGKGWIRVKGFRYLYICSPNVGSANAVGSDQTINVCGSRVLGFNPALIGYNPDLGNSVCRPFVVTNTRERLNVSFPVYIADKGSMVFSNSTADVTFRGHVTGTGSGRIIVDSERSGDVIAGNVDVPVFAREGAVIRLADGASVAVVGSDSVTKVLVDEGTATIDNLAGNIEVSGLGVGVSSLVYNSVDGGISVLDTRTASLLYKGGAEIPAGSLVAEVSSGRYIYFSVSVDGAVRDISQLPSLASPYDAYDVAGTGITYEKVPSRSKLKVDTGSVATIRTQRAGGETMSLMLNGGTFAVGRPEAWREDVDYWFDASREDLLRLVGEGTWADASLANCTAAGEPYIERVIDCRGDDGECKLWNVRGYQNNEFPKVLHVFPYKSMDRTVGLSYLCLGPKNNNTSRRIPLANASRAEKSVAAKMVIMVFGSQNGGGRALVGTKSGAFARDSVDLASGITTNKTHDIWVNGVKLADPTSKNALNGKWQIVSIDTDGEDVNGFGWISAWNDNGWSNKYGGQNYGEILIFTNEVSELTRSLQASG